MRDICMDKEFVALNTWICNSGVYVITGNKKGGQLELALMLGVFSKVEILYVKLDKCEDLNQLVQVVRWKNSEKQVCVVLDCVSKEILESNIWMELTKLAKQKNIRFFLCCKRQLNDTIATLQYVSGVLEIINRFCGSPMEVKVRTRVYKSFEITFQSFYPKHMINQRLFETNVRKCYKHSDITDASIFFCYEDIFLRRDACNLMLHINNKKYKHYEMETEKYFARLPENIHELWKSVLEFGNGLCDYTIQLFCNVNRTLVFLYDFHNDSKVMAVIRIRDGEISDVIYRNNVLDYYEIRSWIMEYAKTKGIRIRDSCKWRVSEMLLGDKDEIAFKLRSKRYEYIECLAKIFCMRNSTDSLEKWERELCGYYETLPRFKRGKGYPNAQFVYQCIFGGVEDVFSDWIDNLLFDVEREHQHPVVYSNHEELVRFVTQYSLWLSKKLSTDGIVILEEVKVEVTRLLECN